MQIFSAGLAAVRLCRRLGTFSSSRVVRLRSLTSNCVSGPASAKPQHEAAKVPHRRDDMTSSINGQTNSLESKAHDPSLNLRMFPSRECEINLGQSRLQFHHACVSPHSYLIIIQKNGGLVNTIDLGLPNRMTYATDRSVLQDTTLSSYKLL